MPEATARRPARLRSAPSTSSRIDDAPQRRGARHPRHRPRVRRRARSCRTSPSGSRRGSCRASSPPSSASSGCSGCTSTGYGCAGASADRLRPRLPRARGRRQRRPQPGLGPGVAGDVRDLALGLGGAEAGVAAADGGRRGDRLLRADRARRRLRPGLDAHPAPAATATTGSSTARRCGSPTARSPTSPSSGRTTDEGVRGFLVPTGHAGVHDPGHPPASSRCGPRSPPSCCSTTSGCRPTRCCPR